MVQGIVGGVRRASGWSIALGVLMIIAGMIAIFAPMEAGLVVVIVVGWMAIFNGGAQLFYAFSHEAKHRWLEGLLGIIYIIAGIYLLMHPLGGLLAITLLVGSFLVVYGVFAMVLAFRMRPAAGWGWVLFDAIVTIVLGILIYIHWPANTEWVMGTLIGISFIVSGVSRLMLSLAVRRLATRAA